jgi:hypothetical protein
MITDPFLNQLACLCRTEPTRAKWVLVPAHAIGHTIGERLALEAGSWANVRFRTPFDLALETAAPFLVERDVNPIGDDLGAPLMMRLLRELPAGVPGYFRHLAEHPTMGAALWSSLMELRLAGVSARDLPPGAFEHPAKHAELQALMAAYETWLVDNQRADSASIFNEALRHVAACNVRPPDLVLAFPDMLWAPLVRQFVDALPGTRIAPHVPRIPGLPLPRRIGAVPRAEQPLTSPLAFLMEPAGRKTDAPETSVTLFHAGGADAEIEEVFRRILHAPGGAFRFDDVEIACASSDGPALVWQKAQRYGWPVTLASGLPGTATRPVRALLAWCDWIANGFAASDLRRMLSSGDIRVVIPDGPGSAYAAGLLRRAGPTWGRRTYRIALDALAADERERADDPENDDELRQKCLRRANQAVLLRDWIESLLALIPDSETSEVPLQMLIAAAADFTGRAASIENEADGQAAKAITDALAELRPLGDTQVPVSAALNLVRAALAGVRVASDRARPGHLHVSVLARAGYAGRRHTFVVGLQEGQVFPSPFEDPVLLDVERRGIHEALPTSTDCTAEAVHTAVSRLAVLPGSGPEGAPAICLSCSCRDLRDARQTFPSWLMLQAFRLTQPPGEVTYKQLTEALGEPKSQVPPGPGAALDDAGWWLANLKDAGKSGIDRVHAAFPDLAQGAFAEEERASERFTVFDGLVTSAAARLDPRQTDRGASSSGLELLGSCPFSYFLQYGLGLEPPEEDERDPDEWLGPATRGGVLHELYATMMRELRSRKRKADPARDFAWLAARADDKLAELRASMPPPSEAVFAREREGLVRDLQLFLELERASAETGVRPIAFEVGFAARGEGGGEPMDQADPVTISLPGVKFPLRGRIDRIDQLPDGTYEVVDYKTGSYYRPKFRKVFRNGRLLQHVLYAHAAETLLKRHTDPKARVAGGRYLFPAVKGGGQALRIPRPKPTDTAAALRELLDVAGNGAFMTTTRSGRNGDCSFCQFGPVCGGDVTIGRAGVKIENAANEALAPFRALQGEDYE